MSKEKAEIRIEDHAVQAINEDGERYDYSDGYVLRALVGVHCFELQGVFKAYEAAEQKLNQLCGPYSNGFTAMIDTSANEWWYIGSSR
jgi:hypothetical protein